MRLIDADELIEKCFYAETLGQMKKLLVGKILKMHQQSMPWKWFMGEWEECDWVKYDGHGECVHYPKKAVRCSNCCTAFKKELLWKDNYCPNCGAKMDK